MNIANENCIGCYNCYLVYNPMFRRYDYECNATNLCQYGKTNGDTSKVNGSDDMSDIVKFESITKEMKDIYEIKNKNYGNSFSEQFKEYGLTSVCIRLDDKIRRLKSLNKQMISGNVDVDDESVRDTLVDLANYAILTVIELDKQV